MKHSRKKFSLMMQVFVGFVLTFDASAQEYKRKEFGKPGKLNSTESQALFAILSNPDNFADAQEFHVETNGQYKGQILISKIQCASDNFDSFSCFAETPARKAQLVMLPAIELVNLLEEAGISGVKAGQHTYWQVTNVEVSTHGTKFWIPDHLLSNSEPQVEKALPGREKLFSCRSVNPKFHLEGYIENSFVKVDLYYPGHSKTKTLQCGVSPSFSDVWQECGDRDSGFAVLVFYNEKRLAYRTEIYDARALNEAIDQGLAKPKPLAGINCKK